MITIYLRYFILLLFPFFCQSQITKSDKGWTFNTVDKYLNYEESKKIKPDVIEQLKRNKTVFFMKFNKNKKDSLMIDSFYQAFKLGWTFNELVIDDIKNIKNYSGNPEYSYILIEGKYSEGGNASHSANFYLTLTVNDLNEKETKTKARVLCRIDLFPDENFSAISTGETFSFKKNDDQLVLDDVYTSIKKRWILNFTPVYLMAHLGAVSTNINTGIRPKHKDNYKIDNLQEVLSKDTLFVSKRVLKSYKLKGFSAIEIDLDEEVFEDYKYKYKICTDAELYKIFVREKRGKLLFEYVKSGTNKYINIIDVISKKYIYRYHGSEMSSPSLSKKDFKKLCRE